jgi:hypothetical protein
VWARVKSVFTGKDAGEEIARINDEIAAEDNAINARRDAAINERETERQRRRAAIEGERAGVEDELSRTQEAERADMMDVLLVDRLGRVDWNWRVWYMPPDGWATFRRPQGCIATSFQWNFTNGSNTSSRGVRASMEALPRTITSSSVRCGTWPRPAFPGEISPNDSASGTPCSNDSIAGARRGFGSASTKPFRILIWNG